MSTVAHTSQGVLLYIMNPNVSPKVAVVVPQLQGLEGLGGQATSVNITNFDSAGYQEYAKGLVDPGKPGGNVIFDYGSTGHQLLHALLGQGANSTTSFFLGNSDGTSPPTVVAGVLTPPKSGSPALFTRSGFLFNGFVAEFTISAQTNNVCMAKLSIQATGARQMIVKGQSAAI